MPPRVSRAIYWLQAFLAICIVGIHTYTPTVPGSAMHYVLTFVNSCVTLPALSCYFLLAGYLMFAGIDRFTLADYRRIVTRRLVTLVVPWIIWTIVGYLGYLALRPEHTVPDWWRLDHIIFAQPFSKTLDLPGNVSLPLLGTPFGNTVFYYVRDIFIAALLSPVVWWVCRRLGLWTIPLMLLIYFLVARPGIGAWRANWIFFPIGAVLARKGSGGGTVPSSTSGKGSGTVLSSTSGIFIILFWLLLTFGLTWMRVNFDSYHLQHGLLARAYSLITTLLGIAAYVIIAFRATRKRDSLLMALVPFAFFIFATHVLPWVEVPLEYMTGATNRALGISEEWQAATFIFYMIPVRLALIVSVATLIGRLSPGLLSFLTGSRSRRTIKN